MRTRVCKKCERALLGTEGVSANTGNITAGPAIVLTAGSNCAKQYRQPST